jgi:hypothetical protein
VQKCCLEFLSAGPLICVAEEMTTMTETPIYAIRQNGDMLFYKHAGADDGSANWPIQAQQIGNGWDFRQVFAGR